MHGSIEEKLGLLIYSFVCYCGWRESHVKLGKTIHTDL